MLMKALVLTPLIAIAASYLLVSVVAICYSQLIPFPQMPSLFKYEQEMSCLDCPRALALVPMSKRLIVIAKLDPCAPRHLSSCPLSVRT